MKNGGGGSRTRNVSLWPIYSRRASPFCIPHQCQRGDSNPQPFRPERNASTNWATLAYAPGGIRTPNPRILSTVSLPVGLRVQYRESDSNRQPTVPQTVASATWATPAYTEGRGIEPPCADAQPRVSNPVPYHSGNLPRKGRGSNPQGFRSSVFGTATVANCRFALPEQTIAMRCGTTLIGGMNCDIGMAWHQYNTGAKQ